VANHNAKVQPVRSKPIRTTWLKNALNAVGSTSKSVLKEYAPTISGAVDSGADLVRTMRTSVTGTRRGASGTNLAQNKYVKLANTAFKNALDDIKTGHLAGNDDRAMQDYMGDGGFNDLFDEASSGVTFGDSNDSGGGVTMNYVNAAGSAEAFTSLSSSINKQTELTLRTAKAQTDAFVSLTSAQFFQNQQMGSQILSHLGAIEKNLASLVEYNNTNMNKFIESSIAYYDKMGQATVGKNGKKDEEPDDGDIGNVIGSNGGFEFGAYKKYVKSRLKTSLSNSEFKMLADMMDENTLQMLASNPLGMGATMFAQWAMPEILSTTVKGMDSALASMMPNLMKRMSEWGEQQGNTIFGKITGTIAKSMGLDQERLNYIDKKKDIKLNMDATPFDGETKIAITNTITRELGEQTTYLKFIAEHMNAGGGTRGQKQLDKNRAALSGMKNDRTWFDSESKQYVTIDQLNDNIAKSLMDSVAEAFNNTDFGRKLTANVNAHQDEDTKKQMESMQMQLYALLNRTSGDNKIDYTVHNGRITNDLKAAIQEFVGSDEIKKSFINTLNQMALNDPIAMNNFTTGQIRANATRNAKIKSMRENPTRSGILQTDLFEQQVYDKDEKKMRNITVDEIIENYLKKTGQASIKNSKVENIDYRNAVENDSFANGDTMKFMDILRNSSMKTLNNVGSAFMNNDPKALMTSVTTMFTDAASTVANAFNEKFFKPMHDKIFGVKDENGFSRGGAISDMKNVLHDSFLEMQHRLTGKAYKDSSGQQHDKSENSVFGNIKEGIMEKIFGKKQVDENGNPTGKRERAGIFSQVTDGIKDAFVNWHNAMFGDFAKDGTKVDKDNVVKVMQDSLKDKLPNAMLGGVAGGAAGLASGGLLGAMIGGPIGGVVIGTAVGFASKSEKFQKMLFGDEDKDNGLITKKTQKFVKDNKTALIGGAALGGLKGTLMGGGGGFLGTLVGGPVAGALLGMATTTALKSKAFHEFLFGNEEKGRLGVLKSFKNVVAHNKERNGDAAGLSLTGKAVGMGAVGAGAGALTASLLSQIGFMPAMLTAGGPIGGAIVGLGLAIKAQSNTFSQWLFGNRKDKNDPEYKAGVLGQLGNALQVYVLQPFKHTTEEIAADIGFTFKHDVLGTVEAAIEPVGNALSDIAYSIKKKATKITNKIGEVFVDKIADPFVNVLTNTVLKPFTTLGKNVAKLTYAVTKQVALLPFRALDTVTHIIVSPITQVVRKVFHPIKGVKWLMHTVANAFELATGKSLDPVRNVMDKAANGLKKVISSPFTLLKFLFKGVGKVGEKIGDAANFIDDLGEGSALKRMEKGGLFDEKSLKQKYNADVQKNGKTMEYDEWKDKYIKSKDRTGYNYLEKLKQRYEKEKEKGNIPVVNGEVQSFEAWKDDYMRQDLSGRLKARKDERNADKAELKMKKVRNRQNEWNIKKINKLTGGNVWEDTVENRARAEAMSGKKIRWRGEAIDADITKNAASLDPEQIAKGDQKKMSNDVRKISLLQQILNVLMHKNPDGTDPNKVNATDPERERLKHGTSDTGDEDAKENKEEKSSSKVDPNAHNRMSSAQFMTGSKMKNWSIGRRYLQANHMVPDEDIERMSDREVQDTLKKYGVDSKTLSEYAKSTGAGNKVERAIYSIFGKLSGKGYAEGTENAEEGYSVVGEAGRPEIVWTNKGDKVYSDKRKPIRVEIAGYARDAVTKFVRYIRGAAKSLASGGVEADEGVGGARISDTRAAANAYAQIDSGEAAENNEIPVYSAGSAQLALPMKESSEGSQTDTQLPAVIDNDQMAIVKQKQETREKAMDAAKTAEELQAEREAEKQESLGNKLLDGIKNIATNTGAQLKKSTGFFTDWLKMFGKKGLIGAGIIAGIAFLTKTGLLKKLADFLGKIGDLIPAITNQITGDTAWQNDNRANTNGQDAEGELEDTANSFKELGKGNLLGFLTGADGKADHTTAAKAKLIRNTLKKPVKYAIKIGKGIYKGGKALVNGGKNLISAVKTGVSDFKYRNQVPSLLNANGIDKTATVGTASAGKDFTDAVSGSMVDYGDNAVNATMNTVDDAVADATFGVTPATNGMTDVLSDSMVDYGDDVLSATMTDVADNASTGLVLYDPEFAAKQMVEISPTVLTGEGSDVVTDAVLSTTADESMGKALTSSAVDYGDDVLAAGLKGSGDEIAEGAAKLTMESAEETAEKSSTKMGQKILSMVQKFFTKVGEKIGNSKWVTKIMEKLTKSKAFLDKTILGKLVKKATAFLGKHLGAAAATLGTSELAGIALGALNGLTGTARLFQVNKDQVDGTMKLISFAMGGFTGSTVGGIVDIVNEITASMCGFDLLNVAACSAYKLLAGDEKYDKLMNSRDAFKEEYINDRNEDLKDQYATLEKAGLADKWGSEDAYIEAVNNGEVNGKYKSFQDYNSDENASVMERGTKALTNGASKVVGGAKKFLFGEDGEEGYIGATGNRYVKNKDGTFTIYDKDGNPLGDVGDESNFQDDIVGSFKGKKKNGIVGKIKNVGSNIKKIAGNIRKGISDTVSNIGKNASAFVTNIKKGASNAWDFFTKRDSKDEVWALKDGSEMFYDTNGQLYTLEGDPIGDPISKDELQSMIRGDLVEKRKWQGATGFGKALAGLRDKALDAAKSLGEKAKEAGGAIVKGLGNVKDRAVSLVKTVGSGISNVWDFFTDRGTQEHAWFVNDGTGMWYDDTGKLYSATGVRVPAGDVDNEGLSAKIVAGEVREGKYQPNNKTGFEKFQDNVKDKIVSAASTLVDKAKEAGSAIVKGLGKVKDRAISIAKKAGGMIATPFVAAYSFFGKVNGTRYVSNTGDGSYFEQGALNTAAQSFGVTIKKDSYYHYSASGELLDDKAYSAEDMEAMVIAGEVHAEKYSTNGLEQLVTHTIKPGLKTFKENVKTVFTNGVEALKNTASKLVTGAKATLTKVGRYTGRGLTKIHDFLLGGTTIQWTDAGGTGDYYVVNNDGTYAHYNINGDMIEESVSGDEIETMIASGQLVATEKTEDNVLVKAKDGLASIGKKIAEGFKKGVETFGNAVVDGVYAAESFLEKMGRSTIRGLKHAKDAVIGGKEEQWTDSQCPGEYYVKNVDGTYAHYNVNGDMLEESVDAETIEKWQRSGRLVKAVIEKDGVLQKAIGGLKTIGSNIAEAFNTGVTKMGELGEAAITNVKSFVDSVKRNGVLGTLTSPFRQTKTKVYYTATGNYYKRKGEKWNYYSQTGDLLQEGIESSVIDEKHEAGLLVEGDLVEDSAAKQSIKKIQDAAKKAWEKAGNIVKSGWEKFTNWIMGGSGSGVETKKSHGGVSGGFGIGSMDEDDFGELPMFSDTSAAGGSGVGAPKSPKKQRRRGGGFGRKTISPDKMNGHSYYSQTDTRWANNKYEYNNDGGTLGNSGCGPAAMSMVVSDMTGNAVDPTQMAALAQETGTRDNTGTNWNFVSGAATTFGLDSEQRYAPNANFIHDSLKNGNEVVLSGTSTGTGTPYTSAGHYVVAVGEDSNGRIRVNDPRGKAFSRSYKPEELTKYTGSAWSIGTGGYGLGGRRRLILPFGGYGKNGTKPTPKKLQDKSATKGNGSTTAPKNASSGNDKLDKMQQRSRYQSTNVSSSSDAVGTADGEDMLNGFPFLMQTDSRWSDTVYTSVGDNSQTIGTSGCGPTSMAMILRSYGANVTPIDTCKFSTDNGYRTANDGTSWDFFSAIGKKYGVDTESLGLDGSKLTSSLSNKKPVIASMGPSTFTKGGHFIALVGLKDGKVVVNDPASKARSETTYDPSVFTSEGHNFWSFSKDGKGSIGDLSTISSTESIPGASTATTTDTTTSETDVISKIGNVFSMLGSKALEGALTGNWNMDFSQQSASTSTSTASSTVGSTTGLTGNSNTEKIYNYLVGTAGMTPYGAAGLMGNLEAESGMEPTNLENSLESMLGTTDAQYTADIDSGKISKSEFLNPKPGKVWGYGIAQWTSENRKSGLYDLVKSRNVSIGDLGTQLDWLLEEMKGSYSSVYSALKSATSVQDASNIVLHKFEGAKDQSVEAARAAKGMNWYNKYAAASGSKGGFGVKFLRAMNKLTGGRGLNKLLNRMRGGKGGSAADAREAIVGWMLCLIGQNTYTQSGDRSRVMEGVDGHGYGDCSSTCCKIYETAIGKVIGSYTGDMIDAGTVVDGPNTQTGTYPDESKMLPGDLIFYYSHGASGESGHVEMYIGNGQLAGHGSGTGPKIHEMKGYQDNRLSWGGGTWIQVIWMRTRPIT